MAWSEQKNQVFFQRCQNWAASLANIAEERKRLIDLYTNEANGDPEFVDTQIATIAEAVALAGVMNAVNSTVDANIAKLTPFLANQQ